MNTLKKYELGPQGLTYVNEMISQGDNWGAYVLKFCDLDKGKVFTYLPEGMDRKQLEEFKYGGKLPRNLEERIFFKQEDGSQMVMEPTSNLDEFFSSMIESFLKNEKSKICIFEDTLAKSSDPYIKKLKTPHWTYNDKVFHFFPGEKRKNLSAMDVLNSANNSYLVWGAITALIEQDDLLIRRKKLDIDNLIKFAKGVEKIIVSAYDGESYLIWEKF